MTRTLGEETKMQCLVWSIADAKDALSCAVSMESWDGVIKYANQIKKMEGELYSLLNPPMGFIRPDGRYSSVG